jgi:MFS family permease
MSRTRTTVATAVVDRLAPRDLGIDFRWLWASSIVTNLGDGILRAAGPLLVTTLTREPLAVAFAAFLGQLPWVIVGIPAGAIIDRVDRRRLVIVVNILRGLLLAGMAMTIATGTVTLPIVYGSLLLFGVAEIFIDIGGGAVVATKVPKAALGRANARFSGTTTFLNDLAGPPLGALLFAVAMVVPFGVNAVTALAGAILLVRVTRTPAPEPDDHTIARRHIVHEITDAIRWMGGNHPVRALALTIFFFNITFGAAWAMLVLLAQERLGLDYLGYGVLLTTSAFGMLIGAVGYSWLERRLALATMFRIGLALETVTHLVLALTTSAIVAMAILVLFGVHAAVWGTTSTTVRQRAVPAAMLGRVTSVYLLGTFGGMAIGSVVGGVIAQRFGVTGPFWFGFIGSALLLGVIWRTLDDIAHAPVADPDVDAAAEPIQRSPTD